MSTRQLNRACHSAAADAGITKRVSLHTLRHYSACRIMPNLGVSGGEALAW
jgi:site-specific recombinase XerD